MGNLILTIALSLTFLILFSLYGFWMATHPPKFVTNLTPKDLGWNYEKVTLTTEDGIKLDSWFVKAENKSDRVIILLHGYPADKANLLQWSKFLHKDFNLFFFDFRYFGKSQGDLTTLGFNEQKDLETTVEYLEERGIEKIGAMGFSLGGAVAILTASKNERLKAVVSDSAFANLDLMGHQFYQNLLILKRPLVFLTKLWAQIFLGIGTDKIAPEIEAKNLKTPILLIHSKKDQTIPFENAKRLQRALRNNPMAEFFFIEEGQHGFLPTDVQREYEEKVLEFLNRNL